MLVPPSLAPATAPSSPAAPETSEPDDRRAGRFALPRDTWSFALALAAVLVVKAGLLPNVPW